MRLLLTVLVCLFYATTANTDVSQSNVSGGNTSIQGGYSASTTYQSGSSSNSNTTNNSTSNIRSAPPTASAPGLAPSGIDVCSVSASAGVQTFGLGISGGKSFRDENCERIKLARELKANGMSVASVALLCQDPRVFEAMIHAGTPCPYNGKIGKEASAAWTKYNKLRPDYDQYVKDLKVIKEVDDEEITIEPLPKSTN
jgi:hypothetical protein